jgi:UPF0755 protein
VRFKILIVALIVVVALGAFAAARYLDVLVHRPGTNARPVVTQIASGTGLRAALGQLAREGLLAEPRLVELWLRLHGRRVVIMQGRYEIAARASAAALIEQLAAGRVVLESLTLVEGATFADFRRLLAAHQAVRQTLPHETDPQVMAALGFAGVHPEGRFFPDTYRFAAGTADRELLLLAHERMARELSTAWARRAEGLPLADPYEALILASLVEKETGLPAERPLIAAVFFNRLRAGMRLQSDPTVIYGLGQAYDGNIRERDLRADTPYNTYTRKGLTPTPIAMPGADALRAVTQPAQSEALFFVATGRGDGAHVFTNNYADHQRAVTAMLRNERARLSRGAAAP